MASTEPTTPWAAERTRELLGALAARRLGHKITANDARVIVRALRREVERGKTARARQARVFMAMSIALDLARSTATTVPARCVLVRAFCPELDDA